MKKLLSLLAVLGFASVSAKNEIVSLDSVAVMQASQEGKLVADKIKKDIEKFQAELKKAQADLLSEKESLDKQAKALSKDALEAKTEALETKRKKAEREFAAREEELQQKIKREQFSLLERQRTVIAKWVEKESPAAVFDKQTPGLLFASASIDKTGEVLKFVDAEYKVAKNDAPKNVSAPKQTVKQA